MLHPTRITPWAASAVLLLAAPGPAEEDPPDEGDGAATERVEARRDLEKGSYEPHKDVYDSIWFELADEPEHHMLQAFEDVRTRRYQDAARHIRRASTFLKMEASRRGDRPGGVPDEAPLMDAYRDLRLLAEAVAQGRVTSASALDPHFARSHAALAAHHLDLARERFGGDAEQNPAAGRHLDGAVDHVQRGLTWARSVPRRGEPALQHAATVAEALQGDRETPARKPEVSKAFGAVDEQLVVLRGAIEDAAAVSSGAPKDGE